MLSLMLSLTLPQLLLAEAPAGGSTQLVYRGTLAPADAAAQPDARKQFELTFWLKGASGAADEKTELDWLVDERARGQWPWLERFGQLRVDGRGETSGDAPAVLYDRPDGKTPVAVPIPWLATAVKLAPDAEWQSGRLQFHVDKAEEHGGRACWQISVRDQFGPKGTWWRDQQSPLVVAAAQRIVLGRGEEHVLKLELQRSEALDEPASASLYRVFAALGELRGKLARARHSAEIEWKSEELAVLETSLPEIEKIAAGTPLERLVDSADRDLKLQSGRSDAISDLQSEFESKSVGPFSVRGLGNDKLSDTDLNDHVTVLHFWDYRDEPLKEPYGQVGYLDYLYHHRKADKLRVYGVAVDGRLADEQTRPAAERSVRKLKEFMNLSFPVLLDSGGLLKKFGDPRVLGANLPLFVVVGTDGKIAHYHVGLYDVHQDQGLKELDDAVTRELGKEEGK